VSQSNEFFAITLCVAFQQVFIVVYFVINPVQKLLDTSSYIHDSCNLKIVPTDLTWLILLSH